MDHPTTAAAPLDPECRRLLWRCRRGMRELDVLLERFARSELPRASLEQRRSLARFLELPDPVLVDYLLGQVVAPDPELAELALRITAPTSLAAGRLNFRSGSGSIQVAVERPSVQEQGRP